jgi:non-canonical poly(A) RNA polymerase PAPD5/7
LLTVIKQFLAMRGLNEVYLGGLGSFSVTCLIVSMFQMHPGAASGRMDPRRHLGVMLLEFLELYGKSFNTETLGICVDSRKPSYFRKNDVFPVIQRGATPPQTDLLCIQDPNNSENDISRSSYQIKIILTLWAEALDDLVGQMKKFERLQFVNRQNRSLLGVILGGSYGKIEEQRWLMRKVYMDRIGPLEDILTEEKQWGEATPFVTRTLSPVQQVTNRSSGSGPVPNKKTSHGSNSSGPSHPRKSKQGFCRKGRQDEPIVIE